MKKILSLTLALIMLLALFGCAKPTPVEDGAPDVPQTESSESSEPESADLAQGKTIACCMGSITHPVHKVVQYGFCTKAEELGMNPIISGLDQGSVDEFISQWETDISLNNAVGALIWTGDDSYYEMMKELKQQGVYIVVPHFVHDYNYTKDFIDKNISALARSYGASMADYLVAELNNNGITQGAIGITRNGNGPEIAITDGFENRMRELRTSFEVLDVILAGAEESEATNKTVGYIRSNPNMVGAIGACGGAATYWSNAMENTGRTDIIVVALDYTDKNITAVESGTINAIVCMPWYTEGIGCAQALYDLINGAVFNTSESEWFTEVEAPIAYVGGEGENDIQTYRDIYDAAQAYFEE